MKWWEVRVREEREQAGCIAIMRRMSRGRAVSGIALVVGVWLRDGERSWVTGGLVGAECVSGASNPNSRERDLMRPDCERELLPTCPPASPYPARLGPASLVGLGVRVPQVRPGVLQK